MERCLNCGNPMSSLYAHYCPPPAEVEFCLMRDKRTGYILLRTTGSTYSPDAEEPVRLENIIFNKDGTFRVWTKP